MVSTGVRLPMGQMTKLSSMVPTNSSRPPENMKTKLASRPRNSPFSEVWCPLSGSTTWAMVAPTLVSMIWPAASNAHSMVAKKKPMTTPTRASLPNSRIHWTVGRVIWATCGCMVSTAKPNTRKMELRTIAGTVCGDSSGISRKVVATRVVDTATRMALSNRLSRPSNT